MQSGLVDGLPSKENRKLTKEERKALKQQKKEEEKRRKEEEKRRKEDQKRREKEEKEEKKRLGREAKRTGSLKRSGSSKELGASAPSTINRGLPNGGGGDGPPVAAVSPSRGGLSSSQSGIDKRHSVTPTKLTRTKSGTGGTLGKVQAKKGRRPAKFKEKEFLLILENLRQNNRQDTELDLQNHYLDKWAAEDLAEVLAENRTVVQLNLSHNLIGDEGPRPTTTTSRKKN